MHRTIFSTPGVNTVLRAFSIGFLKMTGWKLDGALPANQPKCVLIAALMRPSSSMTAIQRHLSKVVQG